MYSITVKYYSNIWTKINTVLLSNFYRNYFLFIFRSCKRIQTTRHLWLLYSWGAVEPCTKLLKIFMTKVLKKWWIIQRVCIGRSESAPNLNKWIFVRIFVRNFVQTSLLFPGSLCKKQRRPGEKAKTSRKKYRLQEYRFVGSPLLNLVQCVCVRTAV